MEVRDRIKELRRVPAKELIPNVRNWRRHPKEQRAALGGVLSDLGYADALLVRESADGLVLIDGHLRAEITPDALVPVLVTDLSEEEGDKLLAVLDPLASMASMDGEALSALLEVVKTDNDAVAKLLQSLRTEARGKIGGRGRTDPDALPAAVESVTQRGDLVLMGGHRLLCGDASVAADRERLFEGATATLMATDPPYGVDYAGDVLASRHQGGRWKPIAGDALSDEALSALLTAALGGQGALTAIVWHPAGARRLLFWRALEAIGWRIAQEIIWVKNSHTLGRADYQWRHEDAIYAKREGAPKQADRTQTTVWEVNKPHDSQHPTQKPVELYLLPIRNHTQVGDIVYDPFAGSGTALIAAEQLGRRAYCIELDPAYVDLAVQRWEEYAGETATRMPAVAPESAPEPLEAPG